MGFRLWRRKKIGPGLHLNLSKSGPSLRVGPRGAGFTVGARGARTTFGVPGTGAYYTTKMGAQRRRTTRAAPPAVRQLSVAVQPPPENQTSGAKVFMWIAIGAATLLLLIPTYGIVLIPLALFTWWWVRRWRRSPSYTAGQLIKQAAKVPGDQAVELLHAALDADPDGPSTLLACGNRFYGLQCWADAADAYGDYLHHRSSWYIEGRYMESLLRSNQPDAAIERLQEMRAVPVLDDESQASLTASLALAFVHKHDPGQALALASSAPLQKHNLGPGLQQCLYLRAVSRYLSGERAKAIGDLERLYAVNPAYSNLAEAKAEMQAGTYAMAPPKPYPDWYPHQLLEAEGEAPAEPAAIPDPPAPAPPA